MSLAENIPAWAYNQAMDESMGMLPGPWGYEPPDHVSEGEILRRAGELAIESALLGADPEDMVGYNPAGDDYQE